MKEELTLVLIIPAIFLIAAFFRAKHKTRPRNSLLLALAGLVFFVGIFIARTLIQGGLYESLVSYLLLLAVVSFLIFKAYESYKDLHTK